MTLRQREGTESEIGRTRSHYVEKSLWVWLWTCRKTDYMFMTMVVMIKMMMNL